MKHIALWPATIAARGRKKLKLLAGAALLCTATAASADTITISNSGLLNGGVGSFGANGGVETYGEVFTAPLSGVLSSFTMNLAAGGVGELVGGVGAWTGGPLWYSGGGVSSILYLSAPVASPPGGPSTVVGVPYTFSPNVPVVSGQLYVAFLTVYGVPGADAATSMPYSSGKMVSGLDHFVWTDNYESTSWYFANFDAALSATFTSGVPEPATWAMMILGFVGLGWIARRRKNSTLRFA